MISGGDSTTHQVKLTDYSEVGLTFGSQHIMGIFEHLIDCEGVVASSILPL